MRLKYWKAPYYLIWHLWKVSVWFYVIVDTNVIRICSWIFSLENFQGNNFLNKELCIGIYIVLKHPLPIKMVQNVSIFKEVKNYSNDPNWITE